MNAPTNANLVFKNVLRPPLVTRRLRRTSWSSFYLLGEIAYSARDNICYKYFPNPEETGKIFGDLLSLLITYLPTQDKLFPAEVQ